MVNNFFERISRSVIEREVEDVYNQGINLYFPDVDITHPFACDGYVDTKTSNGKILKLIIEYKLDELLASRTGRAKVLIQVLFYLKQFELNGMVLPNVCMVGDKNECFVIHINCLLKYLDEDVDWSVAPSSAYSKYPDLVLKIAGDDDINPFVFNIDKDFSFNDVARKIEDLAENVQRYVHVNEHNISAIYDYFCRNVIKSTKKIKSHDLVGVFMGVITNGDDYYQHPTRKNILVTPMGSVDINGDGFKSFFGYFQRNYTPQEKNNLTAIADRLIEDTDRRNSGDFWTPTLWVDYAHKMISEELGENWKDEYVVWDNCCGSKNLTRDYKFKELYCSTLFQSELDISERYNREGVSFQFDFLNDHIADKRDLTGMYSDKLPKGLKDALLENKPIVFFLNPPYATACNMGVSEDDHKAGINNTMVRQQMIDVKLGSGAENLQHQFMYRIMQIKNVFNLTNVHIALFSKPIYLTGGKQEKFLNAFCNEFSFVDGILFNAGGFSGVSEKWGITFNIWENGVNTDNNNFIHTLVEQKDCEIVECGAKKLYNLNGLQTASDWSKEPIKKIKAKDAPQISSGIKVKQEKGRGTLIENALGYLGNNSNNVGMSEMYSALYSSCSSRSHGYSITVDNFTRCTTLFAARKLVVGDWINDKDEYLAPNESHPRYKEFVNDSVVYSLFNTSSNQSSLRQIEYKDKLWDIKNEFFWMSKSEIMELANENNQDFTYEDARTADERYVYAYVRDHRDDFSPEAIKVLEKAEELVRKSFKYRELFDDDHKEYQILNWDAGFYQLKALWKEYLKDDFEDFKNLYKVLADKMRPMVYELGFLK